MPETQVFAVPPAPRWRPPALVAAFVFVVALVVVCWVTRFGHRLPPRGATALAAVLAAVGVWFVRGGLERFAAGRRLVQAVDWSVLAAVTSPAWAGVLWPIRAYRRRQAAKLDRLAAAVVRRQQAAAVVPPAVTGVPPPPAGLDPAVWAAFGRFMVAEQASRAAPPATPTVAAAVPVPTPSTAAEPEPLPEPDATDEFDAPPPAARPDRPLSRKQRQRLADAEARAAREAAAGNGRLVPVGGAGLLADAETGDDPNGWGRG